MLMVEILQKVAGVTTPLGLIGVVVAFMYYGYARSLKHKEKQLVGLRPQDHVRIVDEYLTRYGIQASDSEPKEKVKLIQKEMELRFQLAKHRGWLGVITFVICFVVAAVCYVASLFVPGSSPNLRPTISPPSPR
jgi:hypothetical protein